MSRIESVNCAIAYLELAQDLLLSKGLINTDLIESSVHKAVAVLKTFTKSKR